MPLCLRTVSGRIGIWNFFFFRGKGKAEEILTSWSKGKLSTISTHVWRRRRDLNPVHIDGRRSSALTPSFSSWFLFVLSSVSFLLFLFCFLILQLKIVPHRSQCLLILQSLEHLHSYCRIPWFKPHATCKNRVKFSQLCWVRKGLNRSGELWRHVTMAAKLLDHNNGGLTGNNGDGNEHGKKAIGLH